MSGGRSKWKQSMDLRGCVAEVARLVLSGENVRSIRCGRSRLGQDLLTAMVSLAKRKAILQQLAASSGLDEGNAEDIFNQVLLQQALKIQAVLQGLPHPSTAATQNQECSRVATGFQVASSIGERSSAPDSTASVQQVAEVFELPIAAETLIRKGDTTPPLERAALSPDHQG